VYSHEIDSYLSTKDFHLNIDEFNYLRDTSPQINYIKFENQGDTYSRYRIGTWDNYNFEIFIKNYNK
jgi:hypothetical protein